MKKTEIEWRIPKLPTILWAIILACTSIELCLLAADYGVFATPRWRFQVYENAGFWTGLVKGWDANYPAQPYVMFFTYAFLHGSFLHLAVNMYTLFVLGPIVIFRIGQARFGLLYFATMLGGAVGFALLSDSFRPMVGASGALFGLAGAIVAWEYIDRFNARLRMWPVIKLVSMLIAINVVMYWAMKGQLAWETHLGGFVTGWIFAVLIDPIARPVEPE
ncbi:MAG: rhomboid family intramembrane serine protease [Paracoccaceae bacterium]